MRRSPAARCIVSLLAAAGLAACTGDRQAERPSMLLFVFDTTRADDVSAYGEVTGTTPTVDDLARTGLLYTHAYAQAPWTLPSHVSLFTGLRPSVHGVGWRNVHASDRLVTLAERLRDAGYETVGVSENGWVSAAFNVVQGFTTFAATDAATKATVNVQQFVEAWVASRDPSRPFFLFVNVVDPHVPFTVRESNPYLPAGITAVDAKKVPQSPGHYFCSEEDTHRALGVLRALHLDAVRAADAKLGDVLATLAAAGGTDRLVTVVTADHGEHFGEHGLASHQFSLHDELLHVPLVVHGLPDVAPAVIDTPVALIDVAPTLLAAAGISTTGNGFDPPLPAAPGVGAPHPILSSFDDLPPAPPPGTQWTFADGLRAMTARLRARCSPDRPVFGDMRAVLRYPYKLIWYERYPAALYDLRADPGETTDLAMSHPDLVEALTTELSRPAIAPRPSAPQAPAVTPEVAERLRELGYLGVPGDD